MFVTIRRGKDDLAVPLAQLKSVGFSCPVGRRHRRPGAPPLPCPGRGDGDRRQPFSPGRAVGPAGPRRQLPVVHRRRPRGAPLPVGDPPAPPPPRLLRLRSPSFGRSPWRSDPAWSGVSARRTARSPGDDESAAFPAFALTAVEPGHRTVPTVGGLRGTT